MACFRRGFTLIELLVFVMMILGACVGITYGCREGILATVGLALVGAVVGLFSPLLLLIPVAIFDRSEPGPPPCFKGTCGPTHYTWDLQAQQHLCRCRCGDRYELIGDQFVRHFDESLQLPYMKRDRRGRWRPERRSSPNLNPGHAVS